MIYVGLSYCLFNNTDSLLFTFAWHAEDAYLKVKLFIVWMYVIGIVLCSFCVFKTTQMSLSGTIEWM